MQGSKQLEGYEIIKGKEGEIGEILGKLSKILENKRIETMSEEELRRYIETIGQYGKLIFTSASEWLKKKALEVLNKLEELVSRASNAASKIFELEKRMEGDLNIDEAIRRARAAKWELLIPESALQKLQKRVGNEKYGERSFMVVRSVNAESLIKCVELAFYLSAKEKPEEREEILKAKDDFLRGIKEKLERGEEVSIDLKSQTHLTDDAIAKAIELAIFMREQPSYITASLEEGEAEKRKCERKIEEKVKEALEELKGAFLEALREAKESLRNLRNRKPVEEVYRSAEESVENVEGLLDGVVLLTSMKLTQESKIRQMAEKVINTLKSSLKDALQNVGEKQKEGVLLALLNELCDILGIKGAREVLIWGLKEEEAVKKTANTLIAAVEALEIVKKAPEEIPGEKIAAQVGEETT